jgi:hypothetical protein
VLAEWNAACGPDDPVLVVPWSSPDGALHWVDLRDDPDALDNVTEADEYPALLAALRTMNGNRSPVFTAKCDVWTMDAEEVESARYELMLDEDVAVAGIACYIDVLWRERSIFTSRYRMEQMLYRIDRLAADLPHSLALLECTLRPAVADLDSSVAEGFAVTLYVKAVGVDGTEAQERWDAALRAVALLFRSKELSGF